MALRRLVPAPPVVWLSLQQLNLLSGNRPHNGVVLDAEPLHPPAIEQLPPPPPASPSAPPPVWLLLDEVQDVANVGSILRAAAFFGVEGLVLCRKNTAPLSPVASKASSGAMETLPLHTTASSIRFLQRTRAQVGEDGGQWSIVGLSAAEGRVEAGQLEEDGAAAGASSARRPAGQREARAGAAARMTVDCRAFRAERPTLLVVGNEGRGLRPLVLHECERLLHIHHSAHNTSNLLDSLNVATALAIALYQCSTQRPSIT